GAFALTSASLRKMERVMLSVFKRSFRRNRLLCFCAVMGAALGQIWFAQKCLGAAPEVFLAQNKQGAPLVRQDAADDPTKSPHKLQTSEEWNQHLRSEEHTSELQSPDHLVCRLLLEKKNSE